MNKPFTNSQTTFGFISVREIEGLGHCGGLLIVSQIGRPIEFHCSAPVATNRAQKILYGKTYETFLYCEQIGLALIDKAKAKPNVYVANSGPLWSLNTMLSEPVVVLDDEITGSFFSNQSDFGSHWIPHSFEMEQQKIWSFGETHASQRSRIVRALIGSFTKTLSLSEPFERIQKAIEEAQAVAK